MHQTKKQKQTNKQTKKEIGTGIFVTHLKRIVSQIVNNVCSVVVNRSCVAVKHKNFIFDNT